MELNKVLLVGNLTRDPELSYVSNGTALAKLGVALNRRWKDKASGEQKEEATFVDVDAWAGTAEFVGKYMSKGSKIFIEGRLTFSKWEKDGQTRSKVSVTAERVQFAESKASQEQEETGTGGQAQESADDLPFG